MKALYVFQVFLDYLALVEKFQDIAKVKFMTTESVSYNQLRIIE